MFTYPCTLINIIAFHLLMTFSVSFSTFWLQLLINIINLNLFFQDLKQCPVEHVVLRIEEQSVTKTDWLPNLFISKVLFRDNLLCPEISLSWKHRHKVFICPSKYFIPVGKIRLSTERNFYCLAVTGLFLCSFNFFPKENVSCPLKVYSFDSVSITRKFLYQQNVRNAIEISMFLTAGLKTVEMSSWIARYYKWTKKDIVSCLSYRSQKVSLVRYHAKCGTLQKVLSWTGLHPKLQENIFALMISIPAEKLQIVF